MTDQDYEALMGRIDALEMRLDIITRMLTRSETRLCKLLEHLGAAHLIESR
jgi:hypothetical protein